MRFTLLTAVAGLLGNQAMAADLIATRPGVMCASAQALAQLTLPDGDSRSHGADATPAQQAQAQAGGCIDIQPGITVSVQTAHKNTSVVSYRQPGSAASATFVIPNIDFVPVYADDADDAGAPQPALQSQATRQAHAARCADAPTRMLPSRCDPA